jgi:hypothetical protein
MFDSIGLRWCGQLIKMDSNRNLGKYGKQETRGAGKRKAKDGMARAFGEEANEEKKGRRCWRRTRRRSDATGRQEGHNRIEE